MDITYAEREIFFQQLFQDVFLPITFDKIVSKSGFPKTYSVWHDQSPT